MMRRRTQNSEWNDVLPKASFKVALPFLCVIIILASLAVAGTVAYIATNTASLSNSFEPAEMNCEIQEDFSDGYTKKNVCVKNTGDADAYIRVKLLPYWYDKENDTIVAKTSWVPEFELGTGWIQGNDGYYYYLSPVEPGQSTSVMIGSVTLKQDEITLARQVLEIIASCIQAEPADAVKEAWSSENGSVSEVVNGKLVIATAQGGQ